MNENRKEKECGGVIFFFFFSQYSRAGLKPMARLWAGPLLGLKRGLKGGVSDQALEAFFLVSSLRPMTSIGRPAASDTQTPRVQCGVLSSGVPRARFRMAPRGVKPLWQRPVSWFCQVQIEMYMVQKTGARDQLDNSYTSSAAHHTEEVGMRYWCKKNKKKTLPQPSSVL